MTTTTEAINKIAIATGLGSTVYCTARALREVDSDLWPRGAHSRSKHVQVERRHVVNLVLALCVSDSVVSSPAAVLRWRGAGDIDLSLPLDLDRFNRTTGSIERYARVSAGLLALIDEMATDNTQGPTP